MTGFTFSMPTQVIFGRGCIDGVGKEAAGYGKRVFLLYGQGSIKRNGVYQKLMESFREYGLDVMEFPGVSPNPLLSHAKEAAAAVRRFGADVIVAAGGGSVIDESKAVSIGSCLQPGAELWDVFLKKLVPTRAVPIIAVQTLPATSSETNAASVITHDDTRDKFSCRFPLVIPKSAYLDPEITYSVPLTQTAYGCIDIISHLTEGYFSNQDDFSPVQDGLALSLSAAVKQSMDRLQQDPHDWGARSSVMWAGALAWNGLGKAGWEGAGIPCHTLEHPLSGVYDLPHGAGLSITIPAFLTYYRERLEKRLVRFGRDVLEMEGTYTGKDVIEQLTAWYRKLGAPVSFRDWHAVDQFDIDYLTAQAMSLDTLWDQSRMGREDFRAVYDLMR